MEAPEILIVRDPITVRTLTPLREAWHHVLVKGVADVERGVVVLGGEWHMDANIILIADGSEQKNVWGFNIYPNERGEKALEYISLINIRTAQGNIGMELMDADLRNSIKILIKKLIPDLGV